MDRRDFCLKAAAALLASAAVAPVLGGEERRLTPPPTAGTLPLGLADAVDRMAAGKLTSVELTQSYLDRIEAKDRRGANLRAVLEINPRALEIAAQLDRERRTRGPRGPLHGAPLLIKDNIETGDHMMTTAGSLALDGWYAPGDAPLVARLRAAGAVILGKTNMSEWANFRSAHSLSGWSGRGGQTRNPYALNRSPSGSSSGSAVAVAADLCAAALGTETDGSIVSPASVNGIVGLKPTVGLVSRQGIVPISHSQDTAGPLCRSVRDAALLLQVISGRDPGEHGGLPGADRHPDDYQQFLNPDGLRGARLGIARRFFADNAALDALLDHCITLLKDAGAEVIDPADLPSHGRWTVPEQEVLLFEFKTDLNAYLARLPADFPVRSLAQVIRFNEQEAARELTLFDQELLRQAEAKRGLDDPAYLKARALCLKSTRGEGIDLVLKQHGLDAIVTLSAGPAWPIDPVFGDYDTGGCTSPAAVAGYPHISVPAGLHHGLPVGLSFFSAAWSEPKLLKLASGFEHVVGPRPIPRFLENV
jgi:amidase